MKCATCGAEMAANAENCPVCGAAVVRTYNTTATQNQTTVLDQFGNPVVQADVKEKNSKDTMALVSLILSIVGLVFCFCCGGIFSIAGIILGAMNQKAPNKGGLAKIGMILGIVGVVVSIIATIIMIVVMVNSDSFQQGFDYGYNLYGRFFM